MNKKVLLTLSALGIFTFSSQVLSPVLADTTENPPTGNANHQLNKYDCCTDVLVQNTITVNGVKYTKSSKSKYIFAFNNIKIRPNTDVTINIPVDYSISPRGDTVTQNQIDDYVAKNSATVIGNIALKNNDKLTKYTVQSTVHQAKGQTVLTFKFKANDLLHSSENIMMLTGNLNNPKTSPLYRRNVFNFVTDNSPVSSSSTSTKPSTTVSSSSSSTIKPSAVISSSSSGSSSVVKPSTTLSSSSSSSSSIVKPSTTLSSSSSSSSSIVKPSTTLSSSSSVAKPNNSSSSSSVVKPNNSVSSSNSVAKPSTTLSSSSSIIKSSNTVSSSSKSSLSSSSSKRAIKTDKMVSSSTKHLNDAMNNTNSSSRALNNSSNQSAKGHLPQTGEQKQGVLAVWGTGLLASLCLLIKKLVKRN